MNNEVHAFDGLLVRKLIRNIRNLHELDIVEVRLIGLRALDLVRLFEPAQSNTGLVSCFQRRYQDLEAQMA